MTSFKIYIIIQNVGHNKFHLDNVNGTNKYKNKIGYQAENPIRNRLRSQMLPTSLTIQHNLPDIQFKNSHYGK